MSIIFIGIAIFFAGVAVGATLEGHRKNTIEILKPSHNNASDGICPHCENGRWFQPVSDGWRMSRCDFCKGSGKLPHVA